MTDTYKLYFTKGRGKEILQLDQEYTDRDLAIAKAIENLDMLRAFGVRNPVAVITTDPDYTIEHSSYPAVLVQSKPPMFVDDTTDESMEDE